jgi:hypothetical protein
MSRYRIGSVLEPKDESAIPRAVRGLVMPWALTDLLARGRWKHPGDAVVRTDLPWFDAPLMFLTTVEHMRRESRSLDMFADDERMSQLFRVKRSSTSDAAIELPWLDPEQAFLIAVNRIPGDDVAVALDYRDSAIDPCVIARDFWSDPQQCAWRVVAPTFLPWAATLGLLGTEPIQHFPAGNPGGPIVGWQLDT